MFSCSVHQFSLLSYSVLLQNWYLSFALTYTLSYFREALLLVSLIWMIVIVLDETHFVCFFFLFVFSFYLSFSFHIVFLFINNNHCLFVSLYYRFFLSVLINPANSFLKKQRNLSCSNAATFSNMIIQSAFTQHIFAGVFSMRF